MLYDWYRAEQNPTYIHFVAGYVFFLDPFGGPVYLWVYLQELRVLLFLILPAKFTLCPSIHVYTPWKPHVVCGDFQGKKRSPCFIDMLPANPWGILRIFPQKTVETFPIIQRVIILSLQPPSWESSLGLLIWGPCGFVQSRCKKKRRHQSFVSFISNSIMKTNTHTNGCNTHNNS